VIVTATNELFDDVILDIDRGIQGKNCGIPMGFSTLSRCINGIQKGIYTLVGGNSGTGKTSFVDLAYVMYPYEWYIKNKDRTDIKLKIFYFSMERGTKYKIAKWTCLKLFRDHRIIMDVPTMLGWEGKKYEITPELRTLICGYKAYFYDMLNSGVLHIMPGAENPTGIFHYCTNYANAHGKWVQISSVSKRYVPDDPNEYIIVVNDHVGKLKGEKREGKMLNDKELLDKHSEYMGIIRDAYGYSPVDICQFNRAIGNIERFKNKEVTPEPDDFKGSGDMYENADVVIGLFNPYKFKISEFLGYNIKKLVSPTGENRFRSVSVIKNSYGVDDVILGMNFLGENGMFRELPVSSEMNDKNYKRALEFN
jgi:hypothetical protein